MPRAPARYRPRDGMSDIGTALVGGTASHVGTQFGPDYLALPEHQWDEPGLLVRICGDGGCITRRSTDAGPDLAMQRDGRVADLNAWDFERVCGCDASTGLTHVTVEYIGEIALPATSTITRQQLGQVESLSVITLALVGFSAFSLLLRRLR
jgi:hypothetical protein